MRARRISLLLLLLLSLSAPVAAQAPVVNPRWIEFTPSPDHSAVIAGTTTPVITSYEVRWFASGATTPLAKIGIGKPTPNATTNLIRLSLSDPTDLLVGIPVDNKIQYFARVAAIGPEGEGESTDSNFFVRVKVQAPGKPTLTKQ